MPEDQEDEETREERPGVDVVGDPEDAEELISRHDDIRYRFSDKGYWETTRGYPGA